MKERATKPRLRFDLRTALWWSLVPLVALYAAAHLQEWLDPSSELVCFYPSRTQCAYSVVSINVIGGIPLLVFASLSVLWFYRWRTHARDTGPHPLIVALGFSAGGLLALLVFDFGEARQQLVTSAAAVFVAALTSCVRGPRLTAWRAVATIMVPLVPIGYVSISVQTPAEIRDRLGRYVAYTLSSAASHAVDQATAYPEKRQSSLATAWLETPGLDLDDQQRDALEEIVGPIDAAGPGLDLGKAVVHLLETRAAAGAKLDDAAAAAIGREGVWINLYVLGRERNGHCLAKVSGVVDPDKPFTLADTTAAPNVRTRTELSYCRLGDALYFFDEPSAAPRRVAKLGCLPPSAASLYASDATEEAMSRLLNAAAAESKPAAQVLLDEIKPAAEAGHLAGFVPHAIEAFLAQRRQQHELADEHRDACKSKREEWYADLEDSRLRAARPPEGALARLHASDADWARAASERVAGPPIADTDEDDDHRANTVHRAILRAHYAPELPAHEHIEPLFGPILDLAHTRQTETALRNRLAHRARNRSAKKRLEAFADGVDFVRYVIGTRRAGWCKFDLRAETELAPSGGWYDVAMNFRLRYCRADNRLVSFDEEGAVDGSWDARGLPRTAPLVGPTSLDGAFTGLGERQQRALEARKAERARTALIGQFYEQLIAGKLTDPAQLQTIAMTEGADALDESTLEAMRRMVARGRDEAAR